MGQGYILDSNVIIDFLSGVLPANGMRFVSDIVNAVPRMSAISKGHCSQTPEYRLIIRLLRCPALPAFMRWRLSNGMPLFPEL